MINQNYLFRNPLLVLQFAGWLAYAITDHIGHLLYGEGHPFASFSSGLVAYLITGSLAALNNKLSLNNDLIRLLVILPLLFVGAVVWKSIFSVLHGHTSLAELSAYSIAQWVSGSSYAFYLFVAWAGLFMGAKYYFTSSEQQQALKDTLLATKQAQLQTLRYQLNPHFLFNVLNSIDVSIMEGEVLASHQMVNHLSAFLRNSLQHQDRNKITLQEEISVMQEFINIEKCRFGDAIHIDIVISEAAGGGLLPPMLLLPLVENALKFAWRQTAQGRVSISADKVGEQLHISLLNSKGQGDSGKIGTGTGLNNTKNRLNVAYENDASLTINETETHYQVTLKLPWVSRYCDE